MSGAAEESKPRPYQVDEAYRVYEAILPHEESNISYRPDDCGKLEEWQRLIELMCSARRGFKRKSSSVGISRQSVCRARYLVVSVPMTCMVTAPRILRTTQRLSKTGSSESIPITLASYWHEM